MPVTLPVPPSLTVTVRLHSGFLLTVRGPTRSAGSADFPWQAVQTLASPHGEAAAVRYCYEFPGGAFCEVHLAQAGLPVTVLKNSNVTRLLWTDDGHFLIGAGTNTVRLWTLRGTARTAVPHPPLIEPGLVQSSSEITRIWMDRRDLCVATRDRLFGALGKQRRTTVTTTRYRLPTLQGLTSYTLPGPREADCQRVRRSD